MYTESETADTLGGYFDTIRFVKNIIVTKISRKFKLDDILKLHSS